MSGDSKIGPVSAIARTAALRRTSSEGSAPTTRSGAPAALRDALPASRLVRLATEIANQGAPVDMGRVSEVRQALANGSYKTDAGVIAQAMVDYHRGGSN